MVSIFGSAHRGCLRRGHLLRTLSCLCFCFCSFHSLAYTSSSGRAAANMQSVIHFSIVAILRIMAFQRSLLGSLIILIPSLVSVEGSCASFSLTGKVPESTITTSTTVTVIITATPRRPSCSNPDSGLGFGGCSNNCLCDQRIKYPNSTGVCDDAEACGASCRSDNDCPTGHACATEGFFVNYNDGTSCADYTQCTSTFGMKRKSPRDFFKVVANAAAVRSP